MQLDHDVGVMSTAGTVVRTWREGDALVAEIRLSTDPTLDPLMARIADGTVRGVSVEFRVTEWRRDGAVRVAERAELIEVSLTSFPADTAATIRSRTMDEEDVAVAETAAETTADERVTRAQRRSEVRTLCRSLGLSNSFADSAINEELSDAELHAVPSPSFSAGRR